MKTRDLKFNKISTVKLRSMIYENLLFNLEFTPDGKSLNSEDFLKEAEPVVSAGNLSLEEILETLLETLTKELDAEWIQLEILDMSLGYACTGEIFNWKDREEE